MKKWRKFWKSLSPCLKLYSQMWEVKWNFTPLDRHKDKLIDTITDKYVLNVTTLNVTGWEKCTSVPGLNLGLMKYCSNVVLTNLSGHHIVTFSAAWNNAGPMRHAHAPALDPPNVKKWEKRTAVLALEPKTLDYNALLTVLLAATVTCIHPLT